MHSKNEKQKNSSFRNWLRSMTWQIDFSQRHNGAARSDKENDWAWFERATSFRKHVLKRRLRSCLGGTHQWPTEPMSRGWLNDNADRLWETRNMLADGISRLLFDSSLVLRATNHRQYYFPRIDFEDVIETHDVQPFKSMDLPRDYLGLPLELHDLALHMPGASTVKVRAVLAKGTAAALNSYRQYLVTREGTCFAPRAGEIVLDCGACIGDVSTLFAAMVGGTGEVHAFDPLPLHNRYCQLQAELNPDLAHVLHFNALAVSGRSSKSTRKADDNGQITPGLRVDEDSFDCTSLDDYAADHLRRVDFIKMDIEGAEMAALEGASRVIREFKPRLAISGYHKPEDLWEIPRKIKELNPNYKLYFGHHSPVQWESVFYAVDA